MGKGQKNRRWEWQNLIISHTNGIDKTQPQILQVQVFGRQPQLYCIPILKTLFFSSAAITSKNCGNYTVIFVLYFPVVLAYFPNCPCLLSQEEFCACAPGPVTVTLLIILLLLLSNPNPNKGIIHIHPFSHTLILLPFYLFLFLKKISCKIIQKPNAFQEE